VGVKSVVIGDRPGRERSPITSRYPNNDIVIGPGRGNRRGSGLVPGGIPGHIVDDVRGPDSADSRAVIIIDDQNPSARFVPRSRNTERTKQDKRKSKYEMFAIHFIQYIFANFVPIW
jgi:hypothetical protein